MKPPKYLIKISALVMKVAQSRYKYFYIILLAVISWTSGYTQVVLPPADIACPSKDLEVTKAILPAPLTDPCSCSGNRTLQLGIINKTGSDRTSFAMWGKLIRKDINGDPIGSPQAIFACASGITKNSTKFYPTDLTISVSCDQSLEIVDVILAWTSANTKETCEVLKANPSTINPKCGRVESIIIETGVDAIFTTTAATCTANGQITVSPYGGIPPYKIKIGNDERTAVAANGTEIFSLPAGAYSITITDSRQCTATKSRTIFSSSAPSVSGIGGGFIKTCSSNTNGANIGESLVGGYSYAWTSSPTGFSSIEANPLVNPVVTTVYTVRKTNTSTGCFADANVTVTVNTTLPDVSRIVGAFTKTCTSNLTGGNIGEDAVDGYSYAWTSNPAGFTSAIANPSVNPAVNTVYTVRKTNTSTGCFADANVTVTVNTTLPDVSGIGGAFTKTCSSNTNGGNIGESLVGGYSYAWTSNPAGFSSTEANPLVNPVVTTVYTVRKTNTSTGCFADANVTVTVNNTLPDVSGIGGAFTKTCTSNTNGGNIGESPVSGYGYAWTSNPAGFTSVIANPLVNPVVTTVYTVRKTNTSTGCFADANVTVTVNNTLPNVSGIGGAFTKTCTSNTNGGNIGESPVGGYSYAWTSNPAGFTSAIANPSVNPVVTTVYTVRKTNTSTGCFADANVTVTVNNTLPDVSGISGAFTKTCTSNTNGGNIGESPVSGYSYAWTSNPAGFTSAIANPSVNPAVTTVYTVRKNNTSTGCFADANVTVTVNNTVPLFTVCLVQPNLCTANSGSVTINASGGSGFSYSIDGINFSNQTGVFNNLAAGAVTSIQVKNSYGCMASISCNNIVSDCTPNNSAVKVQSQNMTESISGENAPIVKAYPNPFNSKINFVITAPAAGTGNLEIYNSIGQKIKTVYQGNFIKGVQQFEVQLPAVKTASLIYLLRIGDKQVSGSLLQMKQ